MRIVAGEFRGRKLQPPKRRSIRPTSDRVREAIFNILGSRLLDARVLDLFAGTGALGLEALSRGAAQAVFVDESVEAVRLIMDNVRICAAQERAEVVHGKVDRIVRRLARKKPVIDKFQIVFLDPPYGKGLVQSTIGLLSGLVTSAAVVVAEHHVKDGLPPQLDDWVLAQERRYGDTKVSFYVREIPQPL